MEITLTPEQEVKFRDLAARQGRQCNDLVREALAQYLEGDARFVDAVLKGLASLDRGEFVSHAEVGKRIDRLLRS